MENSRHGWESPQLVYGKYLWLSGINILGSNLIDSGKTVDLSYHNFVLRLDINAQAKIYRLIIDEKQAQISKLRIGAVIYIAIAQLEGKWKSYMLISVDNQSIINGDTKRR